MRRRIQEDRWTPDLISRYRALMGVVKEKIHGLHVKGLPDRSSNLQVQATQADATLYDRGASIDHVDEDAGKRVTDFLGLAGWSELMQRGQRDTLAYNDHPMLVDMVRDEQGGPPRVQLRLVEPDLVETWADRRSPSKPYRVREAVAVTRNGVGQWVYHDTSVKPGEEPYRRVVDSQGNDVSPEYLFGPDGRPAPPGGLRGANYAWRDSRGAPVLNWLVYHRARTGRIWDYLTGSGLAHGTVNVGVLWTLWGHAVRHAVYRQRALVDGELVGVDVRDGQAETVMDPAGVAIVRTAQRVLESGGGKAEITSWEPGADPESLERAIALYERRVLALAGLSGSDVVRVAGDPRSGYALAVSNERKRAAQRAYRPTFRRTDAFLARLVAIGLNRTIGLGLPEFGYEPVYGGIPLSGAELRATREDVLALLERGLITQRRALMRLYPEATPAQIDRMQTELDSERQRLASGGRDTDTDPNNE